MTRITSKQHRSYWTAQRNTLYLFLFRRLIIIIILYFIIQLFHFYICDVPGCSVSCHSGLWCTFIGSSLQTYEGLSTLQLLLCPFFLWLFLSLLLIFLKDDLFLPLGILWAAPIYGNTLLYSVSFATPIIAAHFYCPSSLPVSFIALSKTFLLIVSTFHCPRNNNSIGL